MRTMGSQGVAQDLERVRHSGVAGAPRIDFLQCDDIRRVTLHMVHDTR